jgi:hypothetical protein
MRKMGRMGKDKQDEEDSHLPYLFLIFPIFLLKGSQPESWSDPGCCVRLASATAYWQLAATILMDWTFRASFG